MKNIILTTLITGFSLTTIASEKAYIASTDNSLVKVKGIEMGGVKWNDGFWKERFDLVMTNVVPAQYEYFIDFSERNIEIAANKLEGTEGFKGTHWQDGDYCKWLEAQISVYSVTKDKKLLKEINKKATQLAKSVAEDGYFTTHTSIGYGITGAGGKWGRPFTSPGRLNSGAQHETYNMGHFLTTEVTHYRATGDRVLLDAAIKVGDFLDLLFADVTPELTDKDYNQTHLMGLVELYRTTGDKKYLNCVNRIITARGHNSGKTQQQNDTKLRSENRAVGHAVLGPVMYIGAADYVSEVSDEKLLESLKDIWEDIYTRKASFTCGLGNKHDAPSPTKRNRNEVTHECFGNPYEIHNSTAYNETCATYYGAYFSWRLFLLTGEAKYLDVMEKAFYNNLSAMGLDGKDYYYTNVLRWHGKDHRLLSQDTQQRWTDQVPCVCCPTSLVRFLAQTKDYAYAKDENSIYAILYGSNDIESEIGGKKIVFNQKSDYPLDGNILFTYNGEKNVEFNLKLRIPEWAQGATVAVNGKKENVGSGNFATLNRRWKKGDKVELVLPMKPTLYEANPLVEEVRNQVALAYGPLVYCVEAIDLPEGINIENIIVDGDSKFEVNYNKGLLGGVNVIETKAVCRTNTFSKKELYAPLARGYEEFNLKMIPYYAWSNRGNHKMSVFMQLKW